METKVVKFGGTSLCSASQMQRAAAIVREDNTRRVVVVSAPGKRSADDLKITDLLYHCYDKTDTESFSRAFAPFVMRMEDLIATLHLPLDFSDEYEKMKHIKEHHGGRDYFVSRGEYFSARIFAALLGFTFLDAADVIFFHEDGSFDAIRTKATLFHALSACEKVVIPGFYGSMPNDTVKTFARGGSDITGAIVADAAGAVLYENFTDVSGFLLSDPKIIDKSKPVGIITYRELRRLSSMGASVLHEDAVLPTKSSGIPICIKNTDRPEDPGTLIVPKKEVSGTVSGIAGRTGYARLSVFRDKIGVDAASLRYLADIFERRRIPVFGMPRTPDSVAVILRGEDIAARRDYLLNEICQCLEPEAVRLDEGLALLCVIGENMPLSVIPAALQAVTSLAERPLLLDAGADDLGFTFGVREKAFIPAMRAIYNAVTELR